MKRKAVPRKTQQRQLISKCLHELCHPSAEDVWNCVRKEIPGVNKTTIYRNLRRMVDEGELKCFMTDSGVMLFDSTLDRHYHLRCDKCGKISDIPSALFDRIAEIMQKEKQFKITDYNLTLSGICADCQERANRKTSNPDQDRGS